MSERPRLRELVGTAELEVDGCRCALRYFELRTVRGGRRYSCDVILDQTHHIILDDDSLANLETKVARLAPALVLSRAIAGGPLVAA